jgi:hypothetical protein
MKNPSPVSKKDFEGAFAGLRRILAKHAKHLSVVKDGPHGYYLESRAPRYKGKPLMFGAAVIGKNYVSYHLTPVYMNPPALKSMSPELRKRMQGKACFNFVAPDKKLFTELDELTQRGFEEFRKLGYL